MRCFKSLKLYDNYIYDLVNGNQEFDWFSSYKYLAFITDNPYIPTLFSIKFQQDNKWNIIYFKEELEENILEIKIKEPSTIYDNRGENLGRKIHLENYIGALNLNTYEFTYNNFYKHAVPREYLLRHLY